MAGRSGSLFCRSTVLDSAARIAPDRDTFGSASPALPAWVGRRVRAPRRRAAALRRAGKTCGRGLPPWAAARRRSSSRTVPRHRRSAAPWKKGYRSTVPRQIGDLADIPAMDPARGSEAQRAIRRMSDRRDGDVHSSWIDGQRFCPKPFRDKNLDRLAPGAPPCAALQFRTEKFIHHECDRARTSAVPS